MISRRERHILRTRWGIQDQHRDFWAAVTIGALLMVCLWLLVPEVVKGEPIHNGSRFSLELDPDYAAPWHGTFTVVAYPNTDHWVLDTLTIDTGQGVLSHQISTEYRDYLAGKVWDWGANPDFREEPLVGYDPLLNQLCCLGWVSAGEIYWRAERWSYYDVRSNTGIDGSYVVSAVPLPGSLWLLATGLGLLIRVKRRYG